MTSASLRRASLLTLAAFAAAALVPIASPAHRADAHPLGNFTVNRYSRIELYSDVIRVHYVLDMAEIPAFQEMGSLDADGDGGVSAGEANAYARTKGEEIAQNLRLSLDGEPVEVRPVLQDLAFPKGQAGLDTLRLSLVLEADPPAGLSALEYEDTNYNDRLGWREIVVQPAPGVVLGGDVPLQDLSEALTAYPDNQLSSPPDVTSVAFSFDTTRAAAAPVLSELAIAGAPEQAAGRSAGGFAGLIDVDHLTLPVVLIALLAAFGFGAVHALEPGHGKTLVAAYFVGVHGTARQALGLGGVIAVTHSVGVLAIGSVTIFASQWILPERLYPWLSLASGVMVLLLGLRLIAARGGVAWLRRAAHRILPHHHHREDHSRGSQPGSGGPPPWRSLVALGLADGLTPSPSALVVLLAAVSLDRVGLGLALIVAFSIGLATVLGGVCMALIYARRVTDWLSSRMRPAGPAGARLAALIAPDGAAMRLLPIGGACALVGVGTLLTLRALPGAGLPLV